MKYLFTKFADNVNLGRKVNTWMSESELKRSQWARKM